MRILSVSGDYLFVTAEQLMSNSSAVDHARGDGIHIITIPDTIQQEVSGMTDLSGAPIRDLGQYQSEWNNSFVFDFVEPGALAPCERVVFGQAQAIANLVGGLPSRVRAVRFSNTMRVDFSTGSDALGLWDSETNSIVIRRDQLASLPDFAGTLLHELVHAETGYDDVTRDFEGALTAIIGKTASAALTTGSAPKFSLRRLLGR